MATELTIAQTISVAKICTVLSMNDKGNQNNLTGGFLDERLPYALYMERQALEWAYNSNPTDATLQSMANYVFALCGPYSIKAQIFLNLIAPPQLSGPSNQSVNVGQSATFTVTVTGVGPFTFQWFLNGVAIAGASGVTSLATISYTKSNAQLSDSGGIYSVSVTNAGGTTVSGVATLTVTAILTGSLYQGNVDYSTQLLAGTDAVAYQGTFNIITGQPFIVTFPTPGAVQYIVVRYPATEPTKITYKNPPINPIDQGSIPGIALRTTIFGGFKYIFSATGNPFGLNNTVGQAGQVQFS